MSGIQHSSEPQSPSLEVVSWKYRENVIPTGQPEYIVPDRSEPVLVNTPGGVEESDVIESNETTDH